MQGNPGKEITNDHAGETTDAATIKVVQAARAVLLVTMALFLFSISLGLIFSASSTQIFISVAILASVMISCYLIEKINKNQDE
jgi:hypothetical protein